MPDTHEAILSDGTTSINFLTSTVYRLINLQVPGVPRTVQYGAYRGGRNGNYLLDVLLGNRPINLEFDIYASSVDDLKDKASAIRVMLDLAEDAEREGKRQVTFEFQQQSASKAVIADIVTGTLELLSVAQREFFEQGHIELMGPTNVVGHYQLNLIAQPTFRGERAQVVTDLETSSIGAGIRTRYYYDGGAVQYGTNLVGRVDGPLLATGRTGSDAFTPNNGDGILLGGYQKFTDIVLGVEKALVYSVAPTIEFFYSAGAGVGSFVQIPNASITLKDDANPGGVALSASGAEIFTSLGEKQLVFADPGASWVTVNVGDGTLQYWIFVKLTNIGTVSVWPDLQYGPIRSSSNLIKIAGNLITGDTDAALKVLVRNDDSESKRVARLAVVTQLGRLGAPNIRHPAEFADFKNQGVASADVASRNGYSLKVGTATATNKMIQFDGVTTDIGYEIPVTNARLDKQWSIEFFLDFKDSSGQSVEPPNSPCPIISSWVAGSKHYMILIEKKQLRVRLSRNGTTVIKQATPFKGNVKKRQLLTSSTEFVAGGRYACRVIRDNSKIYILAASVESGSFSGIKPFETQAKPNTDMAGLGTNSLSGSGANAPGVVRIGTPSSFDSAVDTEPDFRQTNVPFNGRIERLEIKTGSGVVNLGFPNVSEEAPSTDALALYLFNVGTAGTTVPNSSTAGTLMSDAVPLSSGSGLSVVSSFFNTEKKESVHGYLKLSASLMRRPGRYRLLALVYTTGTANLVKIRAAHGNYPLTPWKNSPTVASAWQVVDLGFIDILNDSVLYSRLGTVQDNPLEIQLMIENDGGGSTYIDEIWAVPADSYVMYDCNKLPWSDVVIPDPSPGRQILNSEYFVLDSMESPTLWGQLNAQQRLKWNPDADGQPGELYVPPRRDCFLWVEFDMEENLKVINNSYTINVWVEPRYLHLDSV